MTTTFRWKLMASYLLLVLLLGAGLYGYLVLHLESYMISGIRDHLLDEARIASLMAAKEIQDMHRDSPAITAEVAKAIRARVTIITRDGVVTGDSEVHGEELARLENHSGRPEVVQALAGGTGSSVRYSATLRIDMLYVAVPFGSQGLVRLALPLSELEQAKGKLQRSLGATLGVAVLLSLLLSYVLSNVTSRNLRRLTAAASRIGRGNFSLRIPVSGSDEVGRLATVMNDMALRIEAQVERISSEKNRLDAIFKGMGEGVMVTDNEGVVTLVNPAFRSLFGVMAEVEGKQLLEISRHPGLHSACKEVAAARTERAQEIQLAGGETIMVRWVPLLEHDRLTGIVAVFHDISDIKKMERIRRDFVANVSHELRTPVTVIRGYAETLLSGLITSDPQRAERFIAIIERHAERLSHLIGDLLAISELESGEVALQQEELQLEGAVRQTLLLLEQKAEEKGVVMRSVGVKEAPAVLADRGRLDQVLINLLDNAVKYTPPGGTVTIQVAEEKELVRVSVRDTGIGIPAQDLPRIFERFYRVDAARSREQGGTGLGLSIVKHIVQAQGGTVSVQSTPGEGSVFSFTLRKARRSDVTGP